MDISVVIKIALIGVIVAILNSILVRSGRDDYAIITVLAGISAALMMLIPQFSNLTDAIKDILNF